LNCEGETFDANSLKARELKAKLRAGKLCLGAQLALSDPAVAEIFGRAGYDWLVIDTEHAASDTFTVRAMLQAAEHTSAVVIVRPLRLDPDTIRRFLDLGSPGVLCPFINTGEEARRLVQACRYPPGGIRGYGPRRAGVYGFDADEYFRQANEAMICIPIIESREAVENIEAIVSVDGIDGVSVGPMDLSISLGCFKQFESPPYLEAVDKIRRACRKHNKAMGTGCYSLDHARHCVENGDTLLLVAGDDQFLAAEARRCLSALKGEKA
jgi:2-keto-3-deoxy-L-rhamnonate aldolase RhmA